MQERQNDEWPDTKEAGKASHNCELIHGATILQGTRLDITANRYCQLIRDANKAKRLEFARHVLESGNLFQNMIFSYECSVSLEQYRKIDELTKRKLRPKHIETKRKCLTVVIFHHIIINSFEREEACTKFATAEDYC